MHVGDIVLQKRWRKVCRLLAVRESEAEVWSSPAEIVAGHEFKHKACRSVAMARPVYIPTSAEWKALKMCV